jgi:hypothetical protein
MPGISASTTLGKSVRTVRAQEPTKSFQEVIMNVKKFLEIGGFISGAILIAFGIGVIALALSGQHTVNSSLKQQQITGSSDMTPAGIKAEAKASGLTDAQVGGYPSCSVANKLITNGSQARCFAEYMRIHALEASGGAYYSQMGMYIAKAGTPKSQLSPGGGTSNKAYAQLDPTTKQPVSNGARNTWVTETALTTALNVSYMADQLSLFSIVVGVALLLTGFGFVILDWVALHRRREANAASSQQASAVRPKTVTA